MKRRREVETADYINGFLRRAIAGAGRRLVDADPEDLAQLVRARDELNAVIASAVPAMRDRYGWSWAEIGRALGVTRQAAQQAYGRKSAA